MEYSFEKAYLQVQAGEQKEVRNLIMQGLNLKSPQAFYNRLKGLIEPKVSEAKIIEEIFTSFGITDIWGEQL